MKIKSLHIDSYRHLQNVHFDFTYPEGHSDAGKPLKKICIIGQSATGKTSVLELIKNSISVSSSAEVVNDKFLWDEFQLGFSGQLEYLMDGDSLKIKKNTIIFNEQEFHDLPANGGGTLRKLTESKFKLLYLSADLISREAINIFTKSPVDISAELSTEKYSGLQKNFNTDNYIYELGQDANLELWFSILSKVLDYRKRFTQFASELINKGPIGDFAKISKHFEKWAEDNENPIASFADRFNPLLKKLNLEVDLVDTQYPISIKARNNNEVIPVSSLSTGTKGLLLSMFPLHQLDTTNGMILLDEPERSLFPDIQTDLISHYQNLASDAQLIVATHSPFIAAAFEPEERFILYFDENGKVAVRRGESPIGDDPNDILANDFKVDYYNDFGKNAYRDYLNLRSKLTQENEPKKKKELLIELTELGDKYNF